MSPVHLGILNYSSNIQATTDSTYGRAMDQLPPEVYSAIMTYLAQQDLLTLARTSRTFQSAAEARLYESVVFRDATSAFYGCHALTVRDSFRGPYVRRFVLYQDPRRLHPRMNLSSVPRPFWHSVQQALIAMVNLDYLVLHDPTLAQGWVLAHEKIAFQLHEANLRLLWDAHLVAFLQRQNKLRALLLPMGDAAAASASVDDRNRDGNGPLCPLRITTLQTLEIFSGPLLAAAELLACPLTRLQITIDQDTAPILPTVVADLGKVMSTLRKLHIVNIPEALALETLQLVSTAVFAPILRAVGVLPVTTHDLPAVHRCLMKLPALELIELDVSRWDPQPHECFQRIVLLDLRIYCPSLQQVVIWIGQHRFLWFCRDGEWASMHQAGRLAGSDLWRS